MSSLPDCMYDYRYDRNEEVYIENKYDFEVLGTCCLCGHVVTDEQDFTITDGKYLMHDKCKCK